MAVSLAIAGTEAGGGSEPHAGLDTWVFGCLAVTLGLRLLLRNQRFESRILIIIDFFTVLLYAYFPPNFLLVELMLLPPLLLEIPFAFPFLPGLGLLALLGIPGSVFLSYANFSAMTVGVRGASVRASTIAIIYYGVVTTAAIALGALVAHAERLDADVRQLRTLNAQLSKINRDISGKIFTLKRDLAIGERKRISKEIHDTAGYVFINLIMMLQAASAIIYRNTEKAESLINQARDYAGRGIEEIRHILREVRSFNPLPQSLQNELFEVADSFRKATGVSLSIEFGNWPKTFSREIDLFFTSFLQEGLTNSLKHGNAAAIDVLCRETREEIMMSIRDNGSGAASPISKGIGISGIEEFVGSLDGSVEIGANQPGFRITVTLPQSAVRRAGLEA